MNIVYACNSKIFHGLLITAVSFLKTNPGEHHLFVITGDFTNLDPRFTPMEEKDAAFLRKVAKTYNEKNEVTLINGTELFNDMMHNSVNMKTKYTPYTMMRLIMDKMEEIPSRILYIDIDTIVMSDLSPVWNLNMDGHDFAAVPDAVGSHFFGKDYVNAGIILFNMEEIRKDGCFDVARDITIKRWMFMPDQTALNEAAFGKKLFLDQKYNDQRELHENTVIRHYCKQLKAFPIMHVINAKPWNIDDMHKVYKVHIHDELLNECLGLYEEWKKQQ